MRLHWHPASPPSQIAMLTVLQHDWNDVEPVICNLLKGEHKTPEFLKLNPRG